MNPEPTAEKAYQYIYHLAVNIGCRPAGSKAEFNAFSFISNKLQQWGYTLHIQPVPFASLPKLFLPYGLGGLYLLFCGIFINFPLLGLTPPFLFYMLPFCSRKSLQKRKKDQLTQNIFANFSKPDYSKPFLILSAHVDSGRASTFTNVVFLYINYYAIFFAQRIAIALAVFSFLSLLHLPISQTIVYILQMMCIFSGGWLFIYQWIDQMAHQNRYSPGANDNASGIGVILSLAEEFSKPEFNNTLNNINIGFLFTGAEETGAYGAEAFSSCITKDNAAVLCLDMVGCGETILYATKDGTFSPIYTSSLLNSLMKKANSNIIPTSYIIKTGDFTAFCSKNIHASAIQTKGKLSQEIVYHSIHDTIEIIEKQSLIQIIQFLNNFIHILDEHVNEVWEKDKQG